MRNAVSRGRAPRMSAGSHAHTAGRVSKKTRHTTELSEAKQSLTLVSLPSDVLSHTCTYLCVTDWLALNRTSPFYHRVAKLPHSVPGGVFDRITLQLLTHYCTKLHGDVFDDLKRDARNISSLRINRIGQSGLSRVPELSVLIHLRSLTVEHKSNRFHSIILGFPALIVLDLRLDSGSFPTAFPLTPSIIRHLPHALISIGLIAESEVSLVVTHCPALIHLGVTGAKFPLIERDPKKKMIAFRPIDMSHIHSFELHDPRGDSVPEWVTHLTLSSVNVHVFRWSAVHYAKHLTALVLRDAFLWKELVHPLTAILGTTTTLRCEVPEIKRPYLIPWCFTQVSKLTDITLEHAIDSLNGFELLPSLRVLRVPFVATRSSTLLCTIINLPHVEHCEICEQRKQGLF
jgi:hypothetical protein